MLNSAGEIRLARGMPGAFSRMEAIVPKKNRKSSAATTNEPKT